MNEKRIRELYDALLKKERDCNAAAKDYGFEGLQYRDDADRFARSARRMEDNLLAATVWVEARKLLQRYWAL